MQIGINKNNGRVYEGSYHDSREVIPPPAIYPCAYFKKKSDIAGPDAIRDSFGPQYVFYQEYFDSKSRIRTGYILKKAGTQPRKHFIGGNKFESSGYDRHSIWADYLSDDSRALYVAIGDTIRFTVWKVVDVEVVFSGAELVTLKALSTFGILPELLESEIPPDYLPIILDSTGKLISEVYTASAESVVDHCREAAVAILSAKLNESGKDLGFLIDKMEKVEENNKRSLIVTTPATINRLHTRRKTSEVQSRGTRAVTDEDAQLAVSCLGTILVELGYAKW